MIYKSSKGWSNPCLGILSIWRAPRLVPDAGICLFFEGVIIISVYTVPSNTLKTTHVPSDSQTRSATRT